jgi:hypothetical protein
MIQLEGDVLIANKDENRVAPPQKATLVGLGLLTVIMSELDTSMRFGSSNPTGTSISQEVQMTATLYTVSDPNVPTEGENFPQLSDTEVETPEDPSPERTPDGPETPEEGTEGDEEGQDEDEAGTVEDAPDEDAESDG